ncbi:MAG TPA: hypothetical protein VH063_10515 [Gaiellaceae bacterium]|jgi:hypothetical protein|nr:hypothetical protein [Gaiellaceae bacterium]
MRRRHLRTTIALAVAAAAVAVPLTAISLASAGGDGSMTAIAKSATVRFHSLLAAKAAGWSSVVKNVKGATCIANEPVGAMGVHYANPKYLGDAKLGATKPEALVYAPSKNGKLQLAALEYIVFKSAWTGAGHTGAPKLFGQQFAFTPKPNVFGIPAFYSLHVWLWQTNLAGVYKPWNPGVHC